MNKRQEMLVITMEECAELSQACSKLIRFEDDRSEQDVANLQDEIGDVMCMIDIMKHSGLVSEEQIEDRKKVKKEKLMKWSLLFSED
jgi:NTP pyrophosphatase (non-canonical NTP hydrolase)